VASYGKKSLEKNREITHCSEKKLQNTSKRIEKLHIVSERNYALFRKEWGNHTFFQKEIT